MANVNCRWRILGPNETLFSVAQRSLPAELVRELRFSPLASTTASKSKQHKRAAKTLPHNGTQSTDSGTRLVDIDTAPPAQTLTNGTPPSRA